MSTTASLSGVVLVTCRPALIPAYLSPGAIVSRFFDKAASTEALVPYLREEEVPAACR